MQHRSAIDQQDGLHNVVTTPEFQAALFGAIERKFSDVLEPELIELLRRYLSKGDHMTPSSVNVRTPANGGPTRLCERNDFRKEVWIQNNGIAPIAIGGRQVTIGSANDPNAGIVIPPGGMLFISDNIGEWFGATATDGQDVRVLDISIGVSRR